MTDIKIDTEKQILEAARKVFIRKGLDGARMQEIADEAGINKALLHYYFRSKDKLFKMVFSEAMKKFFPSITLMFASPDIKIDKKIEVFVDRYISLIMENPFIPAFIISELNKNPDQLTEFFISSGIDISHVSLLINEVIANEIGISSLQVRHLVVNILGMCIFPFIGRPLLEKVIFQGDKSEYDKFLLERKKVVTELIINSLPNKK
jgi:TetR/AcrR family transcriptional regulator